MKKFTGGRLGGQVLPALPLHGLLMNLLNSGGLNRARLKIKQFRANQRGVREIKCFLFRLEKLFS